MSTKPYPNAPYNEYNRVQLDKIDDMINSINLVYHKESYRNKEKHRQWKMLADRVSNSKLSNLKLIDFNTYPRNEHYDYSYTVKLTNGEEIIIEEDLTIKFPDGSGFKIDNVIDGMWSPKLRYLAQLVLNNEEYIIKELYNQIVVN